MWYWTLHARSIRSIVVAERAEWRVAHKVLEWDRWEEGLIYQTLDLDEEISTPSSSGHVGTGLLRLL